MAPPGSVLSLPGLGEAEAVPSAFPSACLLTYLPFEKEPSPYFLLSTFYCALYLHFGLPTEEKPRSS